MSHYYTQHPVDAIPDCLHCCQRPLQKVGLQAAHRRGRAVGKAGSHCPQQRNGKLHALRDLRPLCTSSRSSRFRTHLLGTRLLFLQASFNFCFLFFVFCFPSFLKKPTMLHLSRKGFVYLCLYFGLQLSCTTLHDVDCKKVSDNCWLSLYFSTGATTTSSLFAHRSS